MANIRLGDEKRDVVTIRLPKWMIKQIKEKGSVQSVLEPIISKEFPKREK